MIHVALFLLHNHGMHHVSKSIDSVLVSDTHPMKTRLLYIVLVDCVRLPNFLFFLIPPTFQASPIAIGGRQAVVEEKRSTNSRCKLGSTLLHTVIFFMP